MYCLKNKLLLLLVILLSITLIGCKQEYTQNIIVEENIFFQKDEEYYVYFYKDNCPYCEDVFDTINEYISNPTDLPLYVCKIDESSKINRKYPSGGQGSNEAYWVDNIKKYEDLHIAGVPSLIKITKEDISFFVTSGRKNILEYFENLKQKEEVVE